MTLSIRTSINGLWLGWLIMTTAYAQTTLSSFTEQTHAFLQRYVQAGKVDYARIQKNFPAAEALYTQIATMDLSRATDHEKKAFYINAYNLIVIYQVVKYYPLKSALDAGGGGFFNKLMHRVAGEAMTLNQLEMDKLLRVYHDARIHVALACAARGCPPLAEFAYTPLRLDIQLQERTQASLNNPAFIRVNTRDKKVTLSKLFEWYQDDFTHGGQSLLSFINAYRQQKIPSVYKVYYYAYDW